MILYVKIALQRVNAIGKLRPVNQQRSLHVQGQMSQSGVFVAAIATHAGLVNH